MLYNSQNFDWAAKLSDNVKNREFHPVSEIASGSDVTGVSVEEDASAVFRSLKDIEWNFSASKTDYFAHGIHPYPAKFIPQLPNTLISKLSKHGDLVWDPFGGSGTTALEALLLGRRAISTDLNPIAKVIGTAKTTTLTPEIEAELNQLVTELRMLTSSEGRVADALFPLASDRSRVPDIPNHDKWFTEEATAELAYLRFRIENLVLDEARSISLACFSKEVLSASNQDSETRYTAVEKHIGVGDVISRFARALASSIDKLSRQAEHLQFREARFETADCRHPIVGTHEGAKITPDSVDLVVTSPPYPNATDYHLYHRFRIFWLGHDPRSMASSEIGSHLRHQKQKTDFSAYVAEMTLVLKNVHAALKPGGFAVFVVGDAIFNKEVFQTSDHLSRAAVGVGFESVGTINRALPENKRSFSSPARRLRIEQILVLRKPHKKVVVSLIPPNYKLQTYEAVLALKEVEALLRVRPDDMGRVSLEPCSEALRQAKRLAFTSAIHMETGHSEPTWQSMLESGDPVQGRRKDPKYVAHGIHPYKGKFYPQLAKALFNASGLRPGSTVLDPFCGSGTVLLEAALAGCHAVGFDVNPVAVATAKAKSGVISADAVYRDHLLFSFERKLGSLAGGPHHKRNIRFKDEILIEVQSWFAQPVVHKLSAVLTEIDDVPDAHTRDLLKVSLSSVIRDVSQQDPRDLRIRRRIEPLLDAPLFELMRERVGELRKRLRHFSSIRNHAPHQLGDARAMLGASNEVSTFSREGLNQSSIDLVVTSPPYATALPYIDTDRLSLLVCHGMSAAERREPEDLLIGSREITIRQRSALNQMIDSGDLTGLNSELACEIIEKIHHGNRGTDAGFRKLNTAALLVKYFKKMNEVTENLTSAVKSGGSAFVVIGDTKTTAGGSEIKIRSGAVIQEQFHAAGWITDQVIPITVTRENKVHSKNTITDNEIYWFKKP